VSGACPRGRVRAPRRGARCGNRGQASVELVGLVLLVSLALAALAAASPRIDGRAVGGFLAHHLVCATTGSCRAAERALGRAYGEHDAAAVRDLAPNLVYEPGERQLPVDWRDCRRPRCANAPDDRALDTHASEARARATAFTHVIRRGGRLYLQYWLYYPDSNTAFAGSDRVWERSWILPRVRELVAGTPDYPGFHRDDWEGFFVRLDPDGSTWVRASSHGHFQGCKWRSCRDEWIRPTGWVRVSRGSHSGHVPFRTEPQHRDPSDGPGIPRFIPLPTSPSPRGRRTPLVPGRNLDERTTSGEGLRLIPLETREAEPYRPLDDEVKPPWRKKAYTDPESSES
jgi:hypothetical protein